MVDQAGHPMVTHSIQLAHCQDIGQGTVVCIDIKGLSIKVFMEFHDYGPLQGEKLQFVGRIMRFDFCHGPTDVGDDSIHTIIMSLVEDSP